MPKINKRTNSPKNQKNFNNNEEINKIEKMVQSLQGRPKRRKADLTRMIIAAFIFLVQIAVLIYGLYKMHVFVLSFYIIFQIIGCLVVVKMLRNYNNPSYKIAWISVILMIPILGLVFYLMWGRGKHPKKIREQLPEISQMVVPLHKHNEIAERQLLVQYPTQERIMKYLHNAGFPLYQNTEVKYFDLGDTFFPELISDMKKAKKFIFLEFFIISEGDLWQEIFSVLKEKVKEGIEVRILYDDFGCMTCLPKNFDRNMKNAGIKTSVFNKIKPVVNNFYMNYRNHQKICVIDGDVGYTGGANIADEYINKVEAFGHWKDTGVRLSGDGVWSLTVNFLQMWKYSNYNKKECEEKEIYSQYMPCSLVYYEKKYINNFVQPFADGPLRTPGENEAEGVYMQMINNAKRYIYMTTPYLVPDHEMITALRLAAKSGVDVRIITPGVSDKKLVHYVTSSYYGVLMEAGIKIYEYIPGFIHAKAVVSDDESAVVGTVNMDFRSFYLHFENGVWICGSDTVVDIKKDFLKTLEYSKQMDYNEWKHRPFWIKALQTILNLFAPLL